MELDFLYPKAESSGDVILSGGIADNTHAIFSFDKDEDRKLFRVHRRIVMSPVGHYLSTVQNEEELVLAVADAMECHNTILTKCRLLHRDISVNNILVVREFEGRSVRRPVKGLLIDYDHAISIDKESSGCATRSGTLPFMSIHNLMGHDSKRTALDDWESLLYLICWQATFGINNADRKDVKADRIVAEILKWRDGDMVDIANEKRKQLHSLDTFKSTILVGFQDQYVLLRQLAVDIYEALFQHNGCEGSLLQLKKAVMSQGIRKYLEAVRQPSIRNVQSKLNPPAKSKGDQASSKQPEPDSDLDPLVNRKVREEPIINKLLTITNGASVLAEEFLGDPAAKQRIITQ
ncbi:hypothetical protein GGI11_008101 [Coemansia sp. RSA 2049]|nr:hypothetical protein GGI11_008101 [Coemansia sp. RSA 2049]